MLGPWHAAQSAPQFPVQRSSGISQGMIHFNTKQLFSFQRMGHRITGDRRQGSSPGEGYVHVPVDAAARPAYVEVLLAEQENELNPPFLFQVPSGLF